MSNGYTNWSWYANYNNETVQNLKDKYTQKLSLNNKNISIQGSKINIDNEVTALKKIKIYF